MTAEQKIATLDRAVGMLVALASVALFGSGHGCGQYCESCRTAVARMIEEAKRLREEGRANMKPSARDEWDVFKRAVESAKSWDDVWSVANHGPKSGKPGGSYYTNLAYLMNCRVPPDGADARQLAIYEDLARRLGRRPLTASEAAEVLRAEVRKQLAQGIAHGQLGAMILPETGVYVGLREAIAAEVRKIDASAEGRAASLQLTTGAPGDKMTVAARTLDGVWSVWHVEAPLAEEK